jgi:hypothetical protein
VVAIEQTADDGTCQRNGDNADRGRNQACAGREPEPDAMKHVQDRAARSFGVEIDHVQPETPPFQAQPRG